MLDDRMKQEVRRRLLAGEPKFQEGDLIEVSGDHVYALYDVTNKGMVRRLEKDAHGSLFAPYLFEGRMCPHEEYWTLLEPRK